MPVFRAAWVLPIVEPPLRDAWVQVEGRRIVAVGDGPAPLDDEARGIDGASGDRIAVLPGLVNAHTHLELSWMRGLIPPGGPMPGWAARLIALRGSDAAPGPEGQSVAVAAAIEEAVAAGTAIVGDISNSPVADAALAASPLDGVLFRELIGFRDRDPGPVVAAAVASLPRLRPGLRAALAPHAPYSVSPALLQAIAAQGDGPLSIHLGESAEEVRFLADGGGAWRDVLERLGAWEPAWTAPGLGAVEYLDRLGLIGPRLLAVHAVQLRARDLDRLAAAGATVVTCPRSNAWTGAGTPPIAAFYASGVRVAVGTDSLASVGSLSVFDELAAMRRLAPDVPARRLLRSATLDGAIALGFGSDAGALSPGRRAALLAVPLPAHITDVEEYLVSGVPAGRIRWLHRPD